jgi:toxin ParE1/3/4
MTYSVAWSRKALDRLSSILDYIAEDNPDAAIGMIDRISARVAGLADQPEMGVRYHPRGIGELRKLIVRPYRVFYLVNEASQTVHVVAVQHMREDSMAAEDLLGGGGQ